jgi:hypothetical protein
MIRPQTQWLLLFWAVCLGACAQQQSEAPVQTDAVPAIVTTSQASSPETRPQTEIELSIGGVIAGTSESMVITLLGKPRRIEKCEWDECAPGRHRILHYDGLTLDLLSDEKGKNFAVTSLEVTSDKWSVSPGLRIGDPVSSVRELYGEAISDNDGSLNYGIKNNDGWINFEYRDGKVTRITMRITLC